MNRWVVAALVLAALYTGWQKWQHRALEQSAVVLVRAEPAQRDLGVPLVFERNGYELTAQASYDIKARLLAREPYHLGREADLSPVDFALGWGPMSDSALLDELQISQSNRFFHLRWQQLSVPESTVMKHAANTHIIPATAAVEEQLDAMRPGQVIELHGYLVNAKAADGWHWQTSLSRTDTGAGACEVFWVESAAVASL